MKSGILSGTAAHAARRLEKKVEGNCIMSSVKLNTKYLANYVNPDELTGIRHQVEASAKMLHEKNGLGSDFLGWLTRTMTRKSSHGSRQQPRRSRRILRYWL